MTNNGTDDKRLFLLDAYALIFRGYYALIKNPRINSAGMDTSAIMGFTNSLFDVIRREKPEYLAVAFDKGGSHERVELYQDYKANRDATPEAIKIAVPYIQRILKAMHIPIVVEEGIEADDLIGTLAKQAEKEGFTTYMVTPDKDYAQLVSENIFMYKPARMGNGIEIWGIPEVQKKFEVERPEQVIDYLGMMGDASDNIPGLPGVGDKTAKKFIATYGSMEGLLANVEDLKGKMKEKVRDNAALGILSKKLATIRLDCPVTFNAKNYELDDPDVEAVHEIFDELEFRRAKETMAKIFSKEVAPESSSSLNSSSSSSSSAGAGQFSLFDAAGSGTAAETETTGRKTLATSTHLYQLVEEGMGTKLFLQSLMQQSSVCFDTETTGLDPLAAELVGIAFSWEKGTGFYLPIPEDKEAAQNIVDQLKPFFESEQIEKIGQNLKYDIKVLNKYGVRAKGPMFDTMLAHYLINPDMRHNMDVLAETYLNYTPQSIVELIGKKGKNQLSIRDVELEKQKEYAVEDADITFQLKGNFTPELASAGTDSLFKDIEMPLLHVLAAMEIEGINLDETFLSSLSGALETDIAQLEAAIYEAAGEEFNIGSPKQLGIILFEKLQLVNKPK
ncbi:MAG: DNA polymerase-1, partial [Flavobacteriales bacterium]